VSEPGRFQTDVFLSVAPAEDAAWVATFRTLLGAIATPILGRPIVIKPDVGETGDMGALVGSAVFLAVLSPEYLASATGTAEVVTFDTTAKALAATFGDAGNRVFNAVRSEVSAADTPEPLRGMWSTDFSGIASDSPAWIAQLTKLAMDLCDAIGRLQVPAAEAPARAAEAPPRTAEAPPRAAGPDPGAQETQATERTVFLAETTRDIEEFRDGVRWELEHQGYTVLPERSLPHERDRLESAVKTALARSGLVVQLVGGKYGAVPDWGSPLSVVSRQSEIINEAIEDACPRLIWISPEAESTTDERQRRFIRELADEQVADRSTHVLRVSFELLKTEVREALVKLAEGGPPPGDERLMIYLMCHEKDRRALKPVWDTLRKKNFNVGIPAFDHDDPHEKRKEHRRLLLSCDASIVFYRLAPHGWYNEKVTDWQQMIGWESEGVAEHRRKLANAVIVTPPSTPEKTMLSPELLIEQRDTFSRRRFDAFFEAIGRTKSAP